MLSEIKKVRAQSWRGRIVVVVRAVGGGCCWVTRRNLRKWKPFVEMERRLLGKGRQGVR